MAIDEGEPSEPERRALLRAALPGMALIVVGVLNTVLGMGLIGNAFIYARMSAAEFKQTFIDAGFGTVMEQNEKQGRSAESLREISVRMLLVWGIIALVAALFILCAGFNLRSLNHFGIVLAGSILAVIPGVSIGGCCGLGQIAGIWSLVLIMDPQVRSWFR